MGAVACPCRDTLSGVTTIDLEKIRTVLRALVPDPMVQITDLVLSSAVRAMESDWIPEWKLLFNVDPAPGAKMLVLPEGGSSTFYIAKATHTRLVEPGRHSFEACLPMVRVPLAAKGETAITTSGGTVFAGDNLLCNLELLNDRLADFNAEFGTDLFAARAEVIVPPRIFGARFGAFGLGLVYDADDALTSYWLMPGMATGESRLLFVAPGFATPIVRRAWYVPTPFSKGSNWYTGHLEMAGREPRSLDIGVFDRNPEADRATGLVSVAVRFERVDEPDTTFPGLLTVQAACRVASIAQAMGKDVFGPIQPALAAVGLTFGWKEKP